MKHLITELEILNNDINADNQFSSFFYTEGDDNASLKVLFVGNSMTIHEPKPEIGWNRTCGMAASDIDHDYVHIVYDYLIQKYGSVSICVCNGGQWELNYECKERADLIVSQIKKYNPNIVIFRIGENTNRNHMKQGLDPYDAYNYLIGESKKLVNNIIVTSLFWKYDLLDEIIKKAAMNNDTKYVDIRDLSDDKTNEAIGEFANQSICLHPNDKGMKAIADRIIKALDE